MDNALDLLKTLFNMTQALGGESIQEQNTYLDNCSRNMLGSSETVFGIDKTDFISKKLTSKLQKQLDDSLAIVSGALPPWCETLAKTCPALFPFEVRQQFFAARAFGISRSIVWIQEKVCCNFFTPHLRI